MWKTVIVVCFFGAVVGGPALQKSREEIEEFRAFLESTRNEHGVLLSDRMKANPNASVWENSGKFEGDILLDDFQVEGILEQYSKGRNAYIWPNTHWPQRTVVYEFGAGEFTAAQRNAILQSIRDIERATCIRFRERRAGEANFVRLTSRPTGCYANVGYWPWRGVHIMNLARDNPGRGCFHPVVIIHEWLHIIGFFHMQSTYNRYDFVRIHWENIQRGMEHNFERYGTNVVSNLGLPYEYISMMHYTTHAFSVNGRPTMTATRSFTGQMGQINFVTNFDWLRVNRHYGCA